MKRLLPLVVAGAFLLSGCAGQVKSMNGPGASMMPLSAVGVTTFPVGERAPFTSFTGTTVHGKAFDLASEHGVTVINAWASWCDPCTAEWPILQQAAASHPQVHFIGVNVNDDKNAALTFLKKYGDNYPHVMDPNMEIIAKTNLVPGGGLPVTLVLDQNHNIAARFIGKVTADKLDSILSELAGH